MATWSQQHGVTSGVAVPQTNPSLQQHVSSFLAQVPAAAFPVGQFWFVFLQLGSRAKLQQHSSSLGCSVGQSLPIVHGLQQHPASSESVHGAVGPLVVGGTGSTAFK